MSLGKDNLILRSIEICRQACPVVDQDTRLKLMNHLQQPFGPLRRQIVGPCTVESEYIDLCIKYQSPVFAVVNSDTLLSHRQKPS